MASMKTETGMLDLLTKEVNVSRAVFVKRWKPRPHWRWWNSNWKGKKESKQRTLEKFSCKGRDGVAAKEEV